MKLDVIGSRSSSLSPLTFARYGKESVQYLNDNASVQSKSCRQHCSFVSVLKTRNPVC